MQAVHNADVAKVFLEIADLLELEDGNPFRVRAYRTAARTVETLGPDVGELIKDGRDLSELPGIGKDIAGRIAEIVQDGTCALREQLRTELPEGIDKLLRIPGLGPKRVRLLYQERGIHTPEQLLRAAQEGQLRTIRGLGEKAEQRILEAVQGQLSKTERHPVALAAQLVEPLLDHLKAHPAARRVEAAGSFRRMKETVGDLDIVVTATDTGALTAHFVAYGGVARVLAHGPTRASVALRQGMQVDLRVVAEESFGAALHYFTGSKAHNIAVRALAQKRGLKINEYGVFADDDRVAGDTEESVFASVGLAFIVPELRENRGEIEAARDGRLPHLLTLHDLKGDLHVHADGPGGLPALAQEARRRGFAYLGVAGHGDADALARQAQEIDSLNAQLDGLVLLKGAQLAIRGDGALALPDAVLARLDYAVAVVRDDLTLARDQQTERMLRAMDHPKVKILAHPAGRVLLGRNDYDVDVERLVRHAKQCGCALELDAQPSRLDLSDTNCRMAKDEGALVAISADAHSALDVEHLRFGVGQARRGWLEKKDVLNTRSLAQLRRWLRG